MSESVYRSKGVYESHCINASRGVDGSYGVDWSDGVSLSESVSWSHGIRRSCGVKVSHGVDWSDGVDGSCGVFGSFGVFNSYGVDKALFLANKRRVPTIFGQEVSEQHFKRTYAELMRLLDGWFPKFNNAFELYVGAGKDWKKVKASEICKTTKDGSPYEAWKDMPKEAIEYIKSWPQFDADMFYTITGIDVRESLSGKEIEVKVDGKVYKAVIK